MSEEDLRRTAVDGAYRAHVDHVYRVAYAILRDPDAAADATHEAFARAFERWEQYDSARPLRPWLHRIVANVALDALRRRRVRSIAAIRLDGDGAPTPGAPLADDPAGAVERKGIIDEGLASLRPDARAAVVLRHYYGYDYQQIGAILGTSSGNVGSLLSRAHAALRTRLAAAPAETDAGSLRRAVP